MEWMPLIVFSHGTGRFVHLLQGLLSLSNRKDKLQGLWQRLGHGSAKAAFCNFCYLVASGDLADKITHKLAKLKDDLTNKGIWTRSTEIHRDILRFEALSVTFELFFMLK
jgi:hypothetical protein